ALDERPARDASAAQVCEDRRRLHFQGREKPLPTHIGHFDEADLSRPPKEHADSRTRYSSQPEEHLIKVGAASLQSGGHHRNFARNMQLELALASEWLAAPLELGLDQHRVGVPGDRFTTDSQSPLLVTVPYGRQSRRAAEHPEQPSCSRKLP